MGRQEEERRCWGWIWEAEVLSERLVVAELRLAKRHEVCVSLRRRGLSTHPLQTQGPAHCLLPS